MNRKDFIKGSCGICIALGSGLLVSTLLDACKAPLGIVKTSANNDVVTIPLAAFEKSNFKLVRVSNYSYDLAIQKKQDGSLETLVLMCTHAGQPLTRTGENYYCTLHGSQFDHEGHVTKGPAEKDLTRLQTKTEHGIISIYLKQTI